MEDNSPGSIDQSEKGNYTVTETMLATVGTPNSFVPQNTSTQVNKDISLNLEDTISSQHRLPPFGNPIYDTQSDKIVFPEDQYEPISSDEDGLESNAKSDKVDSIFDISNV